MGAVGDLERAAAAYREAVKALDEARPRLAAAIVAAAQAGMRQVDIVQVTGYTREQVRRAGLSIESKWPRV